ncbi:uncharacterized protein B0I36DRAFT_312828 [Microdochium trichocladiopsis]|uniref:Uncharacterized protein n=1 Tax=Microdochium trichocladiopsis TaxID=1682393 RepID=A0A9P9BX38_9PEZI|nr:uncharacterized protein B0I36DRAFT_312828 [Microdochium trichocladiopsis]KAH7041427.1 hypothetical protein B0I36DRAFT_312828 [Microdochium trichocladiopsis]
MGKSKSAKNVLLEFIESIPTHKMEGLPFTQTTLYSTSNYRLDMQGMTSGDPQFHNLQIQANKQSTITSIRKLAPKTVAGEVLVPTDGSWTGEDVRQALLNTKKI